MNKAKLMFVLVNWYINSDQNTVVGFELRASTLARQVLYHLGHTSTAHFPLVILVLLLDRVLLFAQESLEHDPSILGFPPLLGWQTPLPLLVKMESHNFFFFCGTRVWTQGLHLEQLHQPFFCAGFFQGRVSQTICPGWLRTTVLLIFASW
jgi:hypothetical protein